MAGYSKAPQGLFVQLRVTRIFTRTSISPGPSLRQCSARYTFRAGRNLPDKEFRYLRTVIVTAAVHRGFNSELAPLLLTFRHWAGVSPYTSACAFAQTCVFGKQSAEPLRCGQLALAPLLPKLRGLFAEFLNEGSPVRLGILYSSTCVGLGYGQLDFIATRLFLTPGASHFLPEGTASRPLTAYHLHPPGGCVFPRCCALLHPIGTGIFTGCPSHSLSSYCLGPTHPTWTDLPSETLDLRRCRFSLHFATHARILTPHHSNRPCRSAFSAVGTLSYHSPYGLSRTSVPGFSPVPFSAQSRSTSELLRTLSRVAASKPTSWLSRHDHIVSHLA
jgi:hypothetical protein